jgi:hypothetical protein
VDGLGTVGTVRKGRSFQLDAVCFQDYTARGAQPHAAGPDL